MLFWGIATLLAVGCLGLMFRPLLRGQGASAGRAGHDLQVYRDQLAAVEREQARGVLSPEEAEAVRVEISRRLLAAAAEQEKEAVSRPSPRRISRLATLVGGGGAVVAALAAYALLGHPGMSDRPLSLRNAERVAAHRARPGQAEAETVAAARMREAGIQPRDLSKEDQALLDQLEAVLAERPDDANGYRLLAGSLGSVGRFAEARAAQERVVEILGDEVGAGDLVNLAELRILAAAGYVSPEAETALVAALERDPGNPLGRYYSGVLMVQAGEPELAWSLWSGLLEEGPQDAPWIAPIRAEIDRIAQLAGKLPPAAVPAPRGPDADDIAAAEEMAPEDRAAMIEGMVAQLGARLAEEGGPPEDWARMILSLDVLGRREQARAVFDEARADFAGDPGALALVMDAGRKAGLLE